MASFSSGLSKGAQPSRSRPEVHTFTHTTPASCYVAVVVDSHLALTEGTPDDLHALLSLLQRVGAEWGTEVALGESWDRSAVGFHVVLLAPPAESAALRSRLKWPDVRVEELNTVNLMQ